MAITKRRRPLMGGMREISPRQSPSFVDKRKLQVLELVVNSVGSGQPAAVTGALPPGAEVLGFGFVTGPAWTSTTVVLALGDSANASQYYSAKDVKANGSETNSQSPSVKYPYGTVITATVTTTGAVATGAITRARIAYLA